MKVAIIDDEVLFLEIIKNKIKEVYSDLEIHLFNNGNIFLNDHELYDIALLDIDMPEIDGIELSKNINERVKAIIFITSMRERMIDAFGANVYAFILKEEIDKRLVKELNQVMNKLNDKKEFVIKTIHSDIVLDLNKVYCVQIENRKLYLYTENKHYQIIQETLTEIMEKLDERFMMVNRSCIVNIQQIKEFGRDDVVLKNGIKIEVSRNRKKECRDKYLDYYNSIKRGWY